MVARPFLPQGGDLDEQMPQRPQNSPYSQPPHIGSQHHHADDDADVVHRGGEGGSQKVLAGVQCAHQHAANPKNNRGEEHDAHHAGGEGEQGGVFGRLHGGDEAGHEPRCKQGGQPGQGGGGDENEVDDSREEPPCPGFVVAGEVGGEGGDEGGAKCPADGDVEDEFGDSAGVGVGDDFGRAGAEVVADGHIPHEAHDAAGHEGEGDDACGTHDLPLACGGGWGGGGHEG